MSDAQSSSSSSAPPRGPASADAAAHPAGGPLDPAAAAGDPILTRLKQMEESARQKDLQIEQLEKENKARQERMKVLSADKSKEMEEFFRTVVQNWLASLTGVSETNKKSFMSGIQRCAAEADTENPVWDLVCCASRDHQSNVLRIEELLTKNSSQEKVIEELRGFRSEAARIGEPMLGRMTAPLNGGISNNNNKRARMDNEGGSYAPGGGAQRYNTEEEAVSMHREGNNQTWDAFYSMIQNDSMGQYR